MVTLRRCSRCGEDFVRDLDRAGRPHRRCPDCRGDDPQDRVPDVCEQIERNHRRNGGLP